MSEVYLDTPDQEELGMRVVLDLANSEQRDKLIGPPPDRLKYGPGGGNLRTAIEAAKLNILVSDPETGVPLHRFEATRGIWVRCEQYDFDAAAGFYAQRQYGPAKQRGDGLMHDSDGTPQRAGRLTLAKSRLRGAFSLARSNLTAPGFIAQAQPSVSLSGFVTHYDEARRDIVVCDARGVTGGRAEAERASSLGCTWFVDIDATTDAGRAGLRSAVEGAIEAGRQQALSHDVVGVESVEQRHDHLPGWLTYLGNFIRGMTYPDHVHDLLQEYIGASILGIAASHAQRGIIFWGPPGGGKSLLQQVVGGIRRGVIFPSEYVAAEGPGTMTADYQRVGLLGKRIILQDEFKRLTDPEAFKAYLTGNTTSARYSGKRSSAPFDMAATAGFISGCNNPPTLNGDIEGLGRRLVVIRTTRRFRNQHASDGLPDDEIVSTLKGERPWIFLWALEGVSRMLSRGGPTIPPDAGKVWAEFVAGQGVTHLWLSERLAVEDDESMLTNAALWERYLADMDADDVALRDRSGRSEFFRQLKTWFIDSVAVKPYERKVRDVETGKRSTERGWRGLKWAE